MDLWRGVGELCALGAQAHFSGISNGLGQRPLMCIVFAHASCARALEKEEGSFLRMCTNPIAFCKSKLK